MDHVSPAGPASCLTCTDPRQTLGPRQTLAYLNANLELIPKQTKGQCHILGSHCTRLGTQPEIALTYSRTNPVPPTFLLAGAAQTRDLRFPNLLGLRNLYSIVEVSILL